MEEEKKQEHSHKDEPGIWTYLYVWIILLVFTAATVASSGIKVGKFNVFVALLIAGLKTGVVLSYFMHLMYEKQVFRIMFFIAVATLTVFISLTFVDVSFRR